MNISKFINEIMAICSPKPINNNKNIIEVQAKNKFNLSLIRKFYCIDAAPPFSQVYGLSKKEGR